MERPILRENGHVWEYDRDADTFFCQKCEVATYFKENYPKCEGTR